MNSTSDPNRYLCPCCRRHATPLSDADLDALEELFEPEFGDELDEIMLDSAVQALLGLEGIGLGLEVSPVGTRLNRKQRRKYDKQRR